MWTALETELNRAKDRLKTPEFARLRRTSPYEGSVRRELRRVEKTTSAQNLTKAGMKMFEILLFTELGRWLLAQRRPKIFLNAELPGSFLFAINQFMKGREFTWVIASYLPRGDATSSHLDDTFGLLAANPGRSLVGEIRTNRGVFWSDGDLTSPKVPRVLAQLAGKVDLYTADGGFDVSGQENLQEQLTAPLVRGEIETALLSLKPGGAMVLKLFTFYTPEVLSYLLLLMRTFDSFELFKPSTSSPMNSEVYFVGVGFRPEYVTPIDELRTPTQQEYYLLNRFVNERTRDQIRAINDFLAGRLNRPVRRINVPVLSQQDRIDTLRR